MEEEKRRFFRVSSDLSRVPLKDHLLHGYEDKDDFYEAVRALSIRWYERTGEAKDERHGFIRLRFHDTPGGIPEEAWLPEYLLVETEMPRYLVERESRVIDPLEEEINEAFGFYV